MIDTVARLLPQLLSVAYRAGDVLLHHYHATGLSVDHKTDGSPVTAADQEADELIVHYLTQLTPHVPVVSEESYASGARVDRSGDHWLVDPLDGTKEFIKRNGHFTVNIAFVHRSRPLLGVVHAPALDILYAGVEEKGSWTATGKGDLKPIHVRRPPQEGLTAVVSRSHNEGTELDHFLRKFKIAHRVSAGSSLKFGLVAVGEADIYPRLGRTMEWDTAAGDAVLRAAGGRVERISDGTELLYGKSDLANPHFIAWGNKALSSRQA